MQVNDIVNGAVLTPEDLVGTEKYFTASEMATVDQVASEGQGISSYWFTAFKNYFGDDMTEEDNNIALGLLRCASNSYEDRIEIDFTFGDNNHFLAGTYVRKFFVINGVAQSVEGDEPAWINNKPDSIFGRLFTNCNTTDPTLLGELIKVCSEMVGDLIPNSLLNFLGAVMDDEEGEEGVEEED
jgi:hypothetical protein